MNKVSKSLKWVNIRTQASPNPRQPERVFMIPKLRQATVRTSLRKPFSRNPMNHRTLAFSRSPFKVTAPRQSRLLAQGPRLPLLMGSGQRRTPEHSRAGEKARGGELPGVSVSTLPPSETS